MLVGVSLESFEELVRQVSQVEEGALGFSLEARQLMDRRGQNIHVTLVVTTLARATDFQVKVRI